MTRYAVASGAWSNPATWNGGSLPLSTETVRPNGFTVTIDQNVTVAELRNDASTPIAAGGAFTLAGSFTITANIRRDVTNTSMLTFTGSAGVTANIIGQIIDNGGGTGYALTHSGGGTLNITGSTNSANIFGKKFVLVSGNGVLNWSGNTARGLGGTIFCAVTGNAQVNLTGSFFGGADEGNSIASNAYLVSAVSAVVTFNGNVDGGITRTDRTCIYSDSGSTININGNITANTGGFPVWIAGTTTVNVNGNISTTTNRAPVAITGACTFNHISGTLTPSASAVAISNSNTNANIFLNGNLANNGRVLPISTPTLSLPATPISWTFQGPTVGSTKVMYSLDALPSNYTPVPANVRSGVVYNNGASTGTCAVPGASSVVAGTPVDNTVGTAAITAATIRDAIGLATANLDTQLSGLASDIDNITVDNAAIAAAVRSELAVELEVIGDIDEQTLDIQSRIPATLDNGKMVSTIGAYQSGMMPPSASVNADAVWAKDISGATAGTAGGYLKDVWGRVTAAVYTMWTNLIAMITGSGANASFTAKAMQNSPTFRLPARGRGREPSESPVLKVYLKQTVNDTLWVYASDGVTPIDLRGKNLQLVFERNDTSDVGVIDSFDVIGSDYNGLYFTYTLDITSIQGTRIWTLWDIDTTDVYLQGTLEVAYAATVDQ